MRFIRSILIALALLLVLGTGALWAAYIYTTTLTVDLTISTVPSDVGLTVSPSTMPLGVGPGETLVTAVTVTNSGADAVTGLAVKVTGAPEGVEVLTAAGGLDAGESVDTQIWFVISDTVIGGVYSIDIAFHGIRSP